MSDPNSFKKDSVMDQAFCLWMGMSGESKLAFLKAAMEALNGSAQLLESRPYEKDDDYNVEEYSMRFEVLVSHEEFLLRLEKGEYGH